jgi:hypothetical protein
MTRASGYTISRSRSAFEPRVATFAVAVARSCSFRFCFYATLVVAAYGLPIAQRIYVSHLRIVSRRIDG